MEVMHYIYHFGLKSFDRVGKRLAVSRINLPFLTKKR